MKILLVGAGLANASLLYYLRQKVCFQNASFTVVESRNHIGGNCFTHVDPSTCITVHKYGPHIFNTNSELAWEFMNEHLTMFPYINRVKASSSSGIYSLPINLHTINQFYKARFSPSEAKSFLSSIVSPYKTAEPRNFEEAMLSHLGPELYHEFIYGYTLKQWGTNPNTLPASIAKRLPFRLTYDDNYYNKRYQAIPVEGYTLLFDKIFSLDNVEIKLNTFYEPSMNVDYDIVFYTGPIDQFFECDIGSLSYRTVYWDQSTSDGFFQGTAVVNYTDASIPYTRINEPIFFEPWKGEHSLKSLYFTEYSKATEIGDIPYYPVRLSRDLLLLNRYNERYAQDSKSFGAQVFLHGRLGTYRYLDMDVVIDESAKLADYVASLIGF